MEWLKPAIVSSISTSMMLIFIYFYFYTSEKRRSFLIWTIGWVFYTLRFVFALFAAEKNLSQVLPSLFALLSGIFLLRGVYLLSEKPFPRFFVYGGAAAAFWLPIASYSNMDFAIMSAPVFFFLGFAFIRTGWFLIRFFPSHFLWRKILGTLFILWGIHKFNYPFLRPLPSVAPFGYFIGSFLGLLCAVGFLILHFERIRRELVLIREKAEDANHAKEQFLSNVSHEIRNPLNGAMGMAYLLEKTPLSREQRDYTDWLNSSLKRLYSIISDILDVSKIYSRQMTLERKLFSFEGAVKEVMESFRDVAKKKNISFRVTVDDSVPPYLYGDPYRFRQVITQLLDNAFKFTHHGQVIFKADTVNRKDPLVLVRIRVLDTGIGIPGETRQKIGEFFYQADSSTTKKYPGLGSGLFLANQLILKMNGYLRIRSNPARGSCFRVEIPFEYSGDLENSSEIAVS